MAGIEVFMKGKADFNMTKSWGAGCKKHISGFLGVVVGMSIGIPFK